MTHSIGRALRLIAPFLLLAAAGCDSGPRGGSPADRAPVEAALVEVDRTPLADTRHAAAGERPDPRRAVLMDMRVDAKARTADPDAATLREVATGLGHDDVRVIGTLEGAFTRARGRERMHLAETGDGSRWILVVGGDRPVRLRAEGVRYLLASPDLDGDGTNEVLLRVDREQDGATLTDLRLLALGGERPAVVAEFAAARVDACATPAPALRAQRIEYGRPAAGDDWPEFVVVTSESECVDGRAPDFQGYLRAERPAA